MTGLMEKSASITPAFTAGALAGVESLAAEAVAAVTRQIYARHPELLQRFGEQGRNACRDDLQRHLEYLLAALNCASPAPFRDYARWLHAVLESRGVPGGHVAESLHLLQEFFRERLLPADLPAVDSVLQAGIAALSGAPGMAEAPAYQRLLPPSLPQSADYLQALLAGNRAGATNTVLEVMARQTSLVETGMGVIQPAMYEIGALWQNNRISVAQEHLATAISQTVMARAFAQADFAAPLNRRALFACAPGNQHSLGLRMVSDAFEVAGWEVQFLGADVPGKDLLAQVAQWRPELLGLSLSLPGQIKPARALVDQLRAELGTQCPAILAGGLATNQAEGLWKALGAGLWAANAGDSLKEAT